MEFALVSLIFFPLLFGMIDYGLWFNDSLNARQGVREGARMGVVGAFSDGTSACDSQTGDMAKLKCNTKNQVGSMSGPTYVMAKVDPLGWGKGKPLIVCAMVKANGVTGLVPLPNDRIIRSKTRMSIELSTALTGATSASDAPPSGADWSWCS
ncbi:MAG: TadE family protein [Aeromicrobium sp.]